MSATTEQVGDTLHCTACSHATSLTPDAMLERAVESALRAPSAYNSQPWLFRLFDDTLELHADLTRAREIVDPSHRELYLSCGAALENVRLTLRHFGHEADITILPDIARPELVARIRVGLPRPASLTESRLFTAIPQRRSNRSRFYSRPLPFGVVPSLEQAVESSGAAHQPSEQVPPDSVHTVPGGRQHRERRVLRGATKSIDVTVEIQATRDDLNRDVYDLERYGLAQLDLERA
jgi:hypothetical protein